MKGIRLAGFYLVAVAFGGSILAWLLNGMVDVEYEKLLSRCVLLLAAAGLWPLARASGLGAAEIGISPAPGGLLWRPYLIGVLTTVPLILLFVVVEFRVADVRVVVGSWGFFGLLVVIFVSAWLVGLFEEVLFRGVAYAGVRRLTGDAGAALVTSLLYAAAHFFRGSAVPGDAVHWYTGLREVVAATMNVARADWDSFLALTLIGLLLCRVRRSRGLWWCVALHAAWVMCVRLFKELTVRDLLSPYQVLVGDYDHFVGLAAVVWLLFLFVCLALGRTFRRHPAG